MQFWESIVVVAFYFVYYDTLLQNPTDIIAKCDGYFITKSDKKLLQNMSAFLLQNAAVLLQNATVITKFDVYFIMCQYKHHFL